MDQSGQRPIYRQQIYLASTGMRGLAVPGLRCAHCGMCSAGRSGPDHQPGPDDDLPDDACLLLEDVYGVVGYGMPGLTTDLRLRAS